MAGISDWMVSFSRWDRLIPARTATAVSDFSGEISDFRMQISD